MKDFVIREYTNIQSEELLGLYNSVHWSAYTKDPQMLLAAFQNSLKVLAAYDGDELIGIIRVVGDGYSIIYIQDILVLPDYQRHGIGKALISEIDQLYPDIRQKVLLTEHLPKTVQFYESCGFSLSDKHQCVAFVKFSS